MIIMQHAEGNFDGIKGYKLYYQEWLPDGEVKGSVQIAHGFAEHSGRYMNVVNKLVPAGYAIFMDDHYGHGKSEGPRGFINRFDDYIEDERLFREFIAQKHPDIVNKPRFLLGHSMGSLIAFDYEIKYPEHFKGLILSGFGTRNGSEVSGFLKMMAKLLSAVSPKGEIDPKLGEDFISRDPAVIEAYNNDPLVFVNKITYRLAAEMMNAQSKVKELAPLIKKPILVQCGGADTAMVGHEDFESMFTMDDKTIKIYDELKHEVYNELEADRNIVLNDLLNWLNTHL